MTDSLLYSINTVAPIFLVVLLGRLLKKFNFLHSAFFEDSDKFVFKIGLPVTLFVDLAMLDTNVEFSLPLIAFCICGVLLLFLLLCLIVPIFVKSNARRSVFVQGIYRSNFAILGFSVMGNMYGDEGLKVISTILPLAIVLFNALAVIALSIFSPDNNRDSFKKTLLQILRNIITNPLIIALLVATPFLFIKVQFPAFVKTTLGYFDDATLMLALMSLGANIEMKSLRSDFVPAIVAALCKTLVVPAIFVTVAVLLGFRTTELAVIFILFGSSTAVSSYIMAKSMKADHILAAEILLLSTVLSAFTLFLGTFIMKALALL